MTTTTWNGVKAILPPDITQYLKCLKPNRRTKTDKTIDTTNNNQAAALFGFAFPKKLLNVVTAYNSHDKTVAKYPISDQVGIGGSTFLRKFLKVMFPTSTALKLLSASTRCQIPICYLAFSGILIFVGSSVKPEPCSTSILYVSTAVILQSAKKDSSHTPVVDFNSSCSAT